LKKLSNHQVNFLLRGKMDHQSVGQTHNIRATVTESPLHTVVIGAVGFRYGDLSVLYSDNVDAAAFGGDGKFLVDAQVDNLQNLPAAEDLRMGGSTLGTQEKDTQAKAKSQQDSDQNDPDFGFHMHPPFDTIVPGQYSKKPEKTQEKVAKSP